MKKESIFRSKPVFVVCAVICTALWGSAFPMVKLGYELFGIGSTADKLMFAGLRFFIAGAVLLLLSAARGRGISALRLKNGAGKWVALTALVQIAGNYFFYYIGLSNTAGSVASVLNSLDTFLSVLIVPFFFVSDRLNRYKITGIILGLSGIIAVNFGGGFSGFQFFGEGFILISSLFSTFGIILNKKASIAAEPSVSSGYFLLLGGGVLVTVSAIMGGGIALTELRGTAVLLYLSGVSAVAFLLWSSLLRHNDVSRTGVFKLLIPIFGNLLSALILHENIFTPSRAAAVVLVCLGIFFVNYRKEEISKPENVFDKGNAGK